MGANFAPSYANLNMGLWEAGHLNRHNPFSAHLVFNGRYIDDIIIIWDGPSNFIIDFVTYCNNNSFGLSFTSVTDPVSICYLDLELSYEGNAIIAKKFTKSTAVNSYLHYSSCHHPRWINNVPKSQFPST